MQSTFITKSNTTMLNFGKPHEYLKDKTVCITGTVKIYKGMAEFIVKEENEIVIQ